MTKNEDNVDRALELLQQRELSGNELDSIRAAVDRRLDEERARPRWRLRLLSAFLVVGTSAGLVAAKNIDVVKRWLGSATLLDARGSSERTVYDGGTDAAGVTTLILDTSPSDSSEPGSLTEVEITPPAAGGDGRKRLEVRLPEEREKEPGVVVLHPADRDD